MAGSALVYSTYLGGSFTDVGSGIAVNSSGNACVTGTTDSLDFPTVNALQPSAGGGSRDAFVAKISDSSATGLALGPGKLTLAEQIVGTTSPNQTAILCDAGSQPLTITSIVASGDFAQTNNCGSGVSAASKCNISLSFKPTAAATRSETITIRRFPSLESGLWPLRPVQATK